MDEAGNRRTETVAYTVALVSCRVTLSGPRPTAGRTTTLRAMVRGFGSDRQAAALSQPVRVTVRGAGVNKSAQAGANGVATIRVKPTRAGTINVRATASNSRDCMATIRARAARSGTAGAGAGGSLTGRPN